METGARSQWERSAPAGATGVTVMTMTERKVIKAKVGAVGVGQAVGQRDPGLPGDGL